MNQPLVPNPAQSSAAALASASAKVASMFRGARTVAFSLLVDRALAA
ncbi:hypothetical protein [Trinickia terrae]|nr:hypothetical protein [Trinickia terrae]